MSIIMAIIVFSILVFIHEFGHFLLAKKNGVKVIEFSIGFGPRIFSFEKGETKYSFKIIPFGGACQMLNKDMVSEEEMANEDLSKSFESKSVWARMSIVLAGPIFNFILAFVLAIIVIGTVGYDQAYITDIGKGSAAEAAGLQAGDIITEYNGTDISIARQIYLENFVHPVSEEPITIKYERDGEEYETVIYPQFVQKYVIGFTYTLSSEQVELKEVTQDGPLAKAGVLSGDKLVSVNGTEIKNGEELNAYFEDNPLSDKEISLVVSRDGKETEYTVTPTLSQGSYSVGFSYNMGRVETDALGVLKYSAVEVGYQISTVFKSLGMLFTGQVTVNDFSGPVGIVDYIDTAYQESKSDGILYVFLNIANLTMLLSANLGVMNLLPIPGLDGGRFLFQILEVILRRPVKHEEYFHLAGMILLMIFAVYIMFQDIFKLF